MSPIEDEIRATLRSEASRLREVPPLPLPAPFAPRGSRPLPRLPRAWRARWGAWLVPGAAAAVVVLVAATLVAVKSLGNGAAAPAASSSPIGGPALEADGAPRYYVYVSTGRPMIRAGDRQTGKTIATYPLPDGKAPTDKGYVLAAAAVSGAADDRTFVVSATALPVTSHGGVLQFPAPTWYLVRIFPGSADPVRVTPLPIQFPADDHISTGNMALSGDGTELAVMAGPNGAVPRTDNPMPERTLQVYSVATGQLQHSWPTGVTETNDNPSPISGLSWVGDSTLGLTVTLTPSYREEVRTLDVTTASGSVLADSRVVWSQDVPSTPPTAQQLAQQKEHPNQRLIAPSHACDTPILTGNGQAVVCGNETLSGPDRLLTAVWLAYPLATPTRPRVIGSFTEPNNITYFDSDVPVNWANPSGTEVISSWAPVVAGGQTSYTEEAVIGGGTVRQFPFIFADADRLAW